MHGICMMLSFEDTYVLENQARLFAVVTMLLPALFIDLPDELEFQILLRDYTALGGHHFV
jgi:hypothetical protein